MIRGPWRILDGIRRYELSDFEWSVIQPLLPDKPRGKPRVDDRKVLNGIYWRLRPGSPWDEIPERYGPPTTCSNRFRRWAKICVWHRVFEAVASAYDGDIQMLGSTSVHVHQHGGNVSKGGLRDAGRRSGRFLTLPPASQASFAGQSLKLAPPSAWALARRVDNEGLSSRRRGSTRSSMPTAAFAAARSCSPIAPTIRARCAR